jgi:hypothetical protein
MEENMNLIEKSMVDCFHWDKLSEPDGAGGTKNVWKKGAPFKAAISNNMSTEMQIAEAQGLKRVYSVTTNKTAMLDYHDAFERVSDGAVFRVTSEGEDIQTPEFAGFSFSQVTAERWDLPR